MIAAGAPLCVQFLQRLGQRLEAVVVVERALHEPDALGQPVPYLLAERRTGVILDGVVDDLGEILVGPVASREPDERKIGGSSPRLARS